MMTMPLMAIGVFWGGGWAGPKAADLVCVRVREVANKCSFPGALD